MIKSGGFTECNTPLRDKLRYEKYMQKESDTVNIELSSSNGSKEENQKQELIGHVYNQVDIVDTEDPVKHNGIEVGLDIEK